MSWREKIQWVPGQKGKASFRGVPFFIDEIETQIGRRTEMKYASTNKSNTNTIDELMGVTKKKTGTKAAKDDVWAEDLGPDADEFRITGYVIQNLTNNFDHFPERDALISALKTPGPGELLHPFYGRKLVSLKERARISESLTKDLGQAVFEMVFVQYKKPIFQQQEPDYKEKIDKSVLSTINAALDTFTNLMNTYGSFLNTLVGPITNTMNKMQSAINSVKGATASLINTALSTVSSAISLIDNVLSSPCDLANQIMDAGQAILGIVGMAGSVVTGGIVGACSGETRGNVTTMEGDVVNEVVGISCCTELCNAATYDISDLDSVPTEQSNNLSLVATMAQTAMLTTATQIAIRILFSNQEDMEALIEKITDALDNLINRLGSVSNDIDDPLLFQKIGQLRSDFVDSMYKKNTDLAKQLDYEVPSGVESTLTLAYNQYGDIERETEIFNRNKLLIKHPGFLPSGEELRILSE